MQSFGKVLKTFQKAKAQLGEILSAVEVLDHETIEFGREFNQVDSPIGSYPFYLLLETSGSNEEHDLAKLNAFLEEALQKHLILNGTLAQEPSKIEVKKKKYPPNTDISDVLLVFCLINIGHLLLVTFAAVPAVSLQPFLVCFRSWVDYDDLLP